MKADDPKLEITVFTQIAEKLGLTRQTIQTLLQNAYAGGSLGKIEKNSEQYKVFLELGPQFQKNTAALSKLYLKTPAGTSFLLNPSPLGKKVSACRTSNISICFPPLFFPLISPKKSPLPKPSIFSKKSRRKHSLFR